MARFRLRVPRLIVRGSVVLLAAALLAGLWLAAAAFEVRNAIAHATGETAALAQSVAAAMERTTERFLTLTPSFAAADLAAGARMRSTTELLRLQAAFDAASAVFLVDASGNVVAASSPLPAGRLDVAASDWFIAGLRSGHDTVSATLVKTPWLRSGPGIVLTRALTKADGAPLGMIGALLPAEPAPDQQAPAWVVPAWAPAGTVIAVMTGAGQRLIATPHAGAEPSARPDGDAGWGGQAFVSLAGLLDIAPAVTASAPVPHSNLRIVAEAPRDAALLRAWPTSGLRLGVLGGIELLLLGAGLVLAMPRARPASSVTDVMFGTDWSFELDQQGRIAGSSGVAPEAVREAAGKPVAALGCTELSEAIARRLRGDGEEAGQTDGIVLRLGDAGAGGGVHRVRLRPRAGGGWHGDGRDITGESEAAARAEAAERAQDLGRQQLAELVLERDRVLSAVGHDVRTPMSSILGICSLLLEGDLEDGQRTWITRMRASCETLLAMLNGLLEIASLDAGKATLHVCEVDVADLVREVVETLTPQATGKGLSLAVRQDESLAGLWMSDPTRLRQILFNLVDNAIKYTHSGKVEVRTAVLSGADGQTSIRITVTDSGPGIAPEQRARIFDRFKRGEGEMAQGGLGLGLALCRDIARLMGGTLTVESTRDVGSEFTFVIPAERVPDRYEQMPYAGHTCVVIGFAGELQRRLPDRLTALGFAVDYASDGFIGFGLAERAATQRGALDLVVLDAALAGMDPAALARRLQAATFARTTRILAVIPEIGEAAGVADVADASVPATIGSSAIARAAGRLVADRSPLATLEAGMAEAVGKRVLIVEDNKINQALLSAALTQQGFTTFVADNGEDAIRILTPGGFDAVLMDIQIPGIDGLETTRRIRAADTPSRGIPIIALTALSGGLLHQRCEEAGVTAIAMKPINAERLGHMLHTWIAQGGTPQPPAPRDDSAFEDKENAAWLGHIQRGWIASGERQDGPPAGAPPEDESGALADDDEDGDPLEVSDAFLECLVAEVGVSRARMLVQTFGRDAMARTRQLQELLPAWEAASIANICRDLDGVATTLGAVAVSECLEGLADSVKRGARDEAALFAGRLDTILVPTLSILMARLASMENQSPGHTPKAA